ncbi:Asp-tRNA(Asn)/Glu-tRNA(Gln) amidotransferase subunit GatC [Ignicoccus hospitalis]|uniref:Glutamyl-tRNA(Gln) amidotransferase, C subunit n=1 Tax=Ignicoccus hospitalis (strain KIN4/I / DSM 18386 / JCM 14125) TaxID=453591 RepID=A8A9I3_IGNH4|nr:Asp-tRNA(Asn)/Glu-tRNA(Gln) amidotransferase subunit GatC [Ignicoccus hospitalis]ABU81585.1 glutamyl-tRNA(Gln) amidotransferase, C subunit [Ignicoccus hospitalis KIN4/I]HIH90520.1 Asp-tRNA(Asn)/Glu-tRNA(Gln) amidotransferase subunit GatC [Desulfurococcaceae archaeon]
MRLRFDARKGAELAKVKLSEEELQRLQKDLDEMAEMLSVLLDLDLEDVEPMYTPSEALNAARPDEPGETLGDSWMYLVPRKEEQGDKKFVKAPRP